MSDELKSARERANYLERAIAAVSDELKGPMSNIERQLLRLDRADMRTELNAIRAALSPAPQQEVKK